MTDILAHADPIIIGRAQSLFGHGPPFSSEECAGYQDRLIFHGAATVAGLSAFTGVRQLGLLGCGLEDLRPIQHFSRLEDLKIAACPISATTGLSSLLSLKTLELSFGLLTEPADILGHASLKSAVLLGQPWPDGAVSGLKADSRCMLSEDRHRKLAIALARIRMSYGHLPSHPPMLVQLGQGNMFAADFYELSESQVEGLLAQHPATNQAMLELFETVEFPDSVDGSDSRFWFEWS